MIKEKCFTVKWLNQFKKHQSHKRIDKIILKKMIYALLNIQAILIPPPLFFDLMSFLRII
jgi:hypothetical protein